MSFDKQRYLGRHNLPTTTNVGVIQRVLESLVDFELNYGRDIIRDFAIYAQNCERVLDIGAGSGADLQIIRKIHPKADLYAIECDSTSVSALNLLGVQVASLNLEREELPFSPNSFDLIVANQVFEHVKEIFWIMHNISVTLDEGGLLAIGVPNLASLHNRILLSLGYQPTCVDSYSAHVRGYTRHDLLRLFESCWPGGYSVQLYRGSNFYPFPPAIAKALARAIPNMAWGTFLLLRKEKAYANEFISVPRSRCFETNFFWGDSTEQRNTFR